MKQHICVDARLYHGGGIGTFLKALLAILADFELTLLVKEPLALLFPQILLKSPLFSLREQLELPLKIPKCDLFWSPHFNIPLLPIRAKKRVVTLHDVYHMAHFSSLSRSQKIYAKTVIPAALRLSDCVTTVSHFSAQEMEKYYFKPKCLEIISCCPLLSKAKEKPSRLPDRYLLFVGNHKPHKNVKRLIEAHAQIYDAPELVIVGRHSELPPHVHALGFVPDEALPMLYRRAELLCFPSTYEGFGLPPLEAMSYGCPVVAGRAGAIPEVCGEAVEYVDPFSVSSIKKGIENVLHNSKHKEELVKKGYERVKEFTLEKMIEKVLTIINNL